MQHIPIVESPGPQAAEHGDNGVCVEAATPITPLAGARPHQEARYSAIQKQLARRLSPLNEWSSRRTVARRGRRLLCLAVTQPARRLHPLCLHKPRRLDQVFHFFAKQSRTSAQRLHFFHVATHDLPPQLRSWQFSATGTKCIAIVFNSYPPRTHTRARARARVLTEVSALICP